MQLDEISQEIGIDLQTESLLVRAEQLARLETDKLVDKVNDTLDITSYRWRCHVANVFSFVLCLLLYRANRVLTARRSICAPATRPYRGFDANDRSTSFLVSKK